MHLDVSISDSGCQVTQILDNGTRRVKTTDLASFISAMGNQIDMDSGYLDPTVIRMARTSNSVQVIAWDKSRLRRITYNERGRDTRRGVREFDIMTPSTLFHLYFNQLSNRQGYSLSQTRLFCIGNDLVVNDNTVVYQFPFSNTSGDGSVCWGNTPVHNLIFRLDNGPSDIINLWWSGTFNSDLDHGRRTLTLLQELEGLDQFPESRLVRSTSNPTARTIIGGRGNDQRVPF
jgi:hypothetical protein